MFERYPVLPYTSTVSNLATDYILLKGDDTVTVNFDGQAHTRLAATQPFSGDFAWWSNRGDDLDTRLTRKFDLRTLSPATPVQMDVAMWWDIEDDYDYAYVLASRDGAKWDVLSGQSTTADDPTGNSFGPAYTDSSAEVDGDEPVWRTESFDLSEYAGEAIWVRFEYVTDDAVNRSGWFIDDIAIPAIDYHANFETGNDGWISEGWLLTDNHLTQRWLLQVMDLKENVLQAVARVPADAAGRAVFDVDGLGDGGTAVLAISGLTPATTEPAEYELSVALRE